MKKEIITAISPITENPISTIEEEKLPQIFTEQVRFLEKANQEYSKAEEKEKKARNKVEIALKEADDLIDAAKKVGGHTAKKKKFLWAEWSSNKDKIDALKNNLKEIIEHSEDSAEAQKKLAEVQSSLMESQTAILQVQKAHMEYQRQIANATKLVFGLSAYNMATSQSVLIKLKAILSGASEEQLGELAQQQLFLVLDQIKNQESIITRINENDSLIENLNLEIEKKQKEINEIGELDNEQNRRISANANTLEAHKKVLSEQKEKDAEHDKKFADMDKADEEQDKLLEEHSQAIRVAREKNEELKKRLDEQEIEYEKQDKRIVDNANKIDENRRTLDKHSKRDAELEQKIQDVLQSTAEKITNLKAIVTKNADVANNNIVLIENNFKKRISDVSESVCKSNENYEQKIEKVSNAISELMGELETQMTNTNQKLENLENRINALDVTVSKKVWNIAVSVVVGSLLILNVLQLIGIV